MGATGRAKRIDWYLMSERKKDDNESEQCLKINRNIIVSYRGRVGESEREKRKVKRNVGNPPLSRILSYPNTNRVS